jgi:hypothetical protein
MQTRAFLFPNLCITLLFSVLSCRLHIYISTLHCSPCTLYHPVQQTFSVRVILSPFVHSLSPFVIHIYPFFFLFFHLLMHIAGSISQRCHSRNNYLFSLSPIFHIHKLYPNSLSHPILVHRSISPRFIPVSSTYLEPLHQMPSFFSPSTGVC